MNGQAHLNQNELASDTLSNLLNTIEDNNGGHFLLPVTGDNGHEPNYKADFQSNDILDGWKSIPQRYWYHSLHQISSYLGRFPPALARYFICKFSRENAVVYDPFSGSGTVPLEAILLGRSAIGNDAFIYGYTLSHAKARPIDREHLNSFLNRLEQKTHEIINEIQPAQDPLFHNITPYYHPTTLTQLLAVRQLLNSPEYTTDDLYDRTIFTKALICGILHGQSQMFLSIQTKDTWSASPE